MLNLFQDRLKVVGRVYNRDPGLEFECVLPADVRAELLGRRKLTKPRSTPTRRKLVLSVIVRIAGGLVLALLVALILTSNLHFYHERIGVTTPKGKICTLSDRTVPVAAFILKVSLE
jgi:hypothetical protein